MSAEFSAIVERTFKESIVDTLCTYITIPNLSPMFDAQWKSAGHMDKAVQLLVDWARGQQVPGLTVDVMRLADRTPLIVMELPATPGNRERMLQYVDGIWDEGGTNIGAGLSAGRFQLSTAQGQYGVNRLILMSDGQPTEGITDDEGLTRQAQELRAAGVTLSAIGVGTDFNEDLMQAFAEYGAGAYGFLEDAGLCRDDWPTSAGERFLADHAPD